MKIFRLEWVRGYVSPANPDDVRWAYFQDPAEHSIP
jgi:hypothetical protein